MRAVIPFMGVLDTFPDISGLLALFRCRDCRFRFQKRAGVFGAISLPLRQYIRAISLMQYFCNSVVFPFERIFIRIITFPFVLSRAGYMVRIITLSLTRRTWRWWCVINFVIPFQVSFLLFVPTLNFVIRFSPFWKCSTH